MLYYTISTILCYVILYMISLEALAHSRISVRASVPGRITCYLRVRNCPLSPSLSISVSAHHASLNNMLRYHALSGFLFNGHAHTRKHTCTHTLDFRKATHPMIVIIVQHASCEFGPIRGNSYLSHLPRMLTVSFHNFKSQKFKLSVSNPKSKHVAYLSVLSQISNCQGLGRKNKHDILKTDRSWSRGPNPEAWS